jgi:hypothetical protein
MDFELVSLPLVPNFSKVLMRKASITPNISRLDGPTFKLYVKDHSSLILRSDEWSPAELRAIAKDIEQALQAQPAPVVEPAPVTAGLASTGAGND